MTQEEKESIVNRLNIMACHGQFVGFPEDEMNFSELSEEELSYYRDEWIAGQFDE